MRWGAAVLFAVVLAGCAAQRSPEATAPGPAGPAPSPGQQGITYGGGDGLSCETAIIIRGAVDNRAGVRAEYAWLAQRYPGYQRTMQGLGGRGERRYDTLTITTADGLTVKVCFDITEFFGKR